MTSTKGPDVRLRKRLSGTTARIVLALALAVTAGGAVLGTATPAAAMVQICAQGGSGYCLNNWNGEDIFVAMYTSNVLNDSFQVLSINPCNSSPAGQVTQTCPFNLGSGFNARFAGDNIVQINDYDSGACVGTGTSPDNLGAAGELACTNSVGNGGGVGTWQVVAPVSGPPSGVVYINRYWTNTEAL
jgi:hypothetical protein